MEELANILKGLRPAQGTSLSTQMEFANRKNIYDTQAGRYEDIATAAGKSPTFAGGFIQGLAGSAKRSKEEQAQMVRDQQAQRMQQLIEYENAQRMKRQEIDDIVQAQVYGQAQQAGFASALQLADATGDTGELYRIVNGNESWKRILQRNLPQGTTLSGISIVQGPDGIKRLAPSGVTPDGQFTAGPALMTIDEGLGTFAPDVVARRAQEKLELQQRQQMAVARLATERAQAGAYNALAEQRRADAQMASMPQATAPSAVGSAMPVAQTPLLPTQEDIAAGVPLNAEQKRGVDARNAALNKKKGAEDVNSILNDIEGQYKSLQSAGAIVDPSRGGLTGALGNVSAAIGSSGPGQAVAGALGTEEQATRQAIKNSLPLLMASIKNATGMSAQQMNSNAELQFYMQAATDPSRDIQSNLNAIKTLRGMFGGDVTAGNTTPTPKLDGNAQAEQIRAAFKAGQITREQARAQLEALGGR